jgi:hypothetical protein
VHQVTATVADIAREPGRELVQVAVDVQHENGPRSDQLYPLLGRGRPVEHVQNDPVAGERLAVCPGVEFVLHCLEVEPLELLHTDSSAVGSKKSPAGPPPILSATPPVRTPVSWPRLATGPPALRATASSLSI